MIPLKESIPPKWLELLDQDEFIPLIKHLDEKLNDPHNLPIYPARENIFKALSYFDPQDTRVVIIGQDPYHNPGQATGLAFAVPVGQTFPPSLRNIFKEIKRSLGTDAPFSGDLSSWAQQGVLLLNDVLTVYQNKPGSHAAWNWKALTNQIIKRLSQDCPALVFMLWGANAQAKKALIDKQENHLVLESVHPSPLSAHRGFIGNNHFLLANEFLARISGKPVDW